MEIEKRRNEVLVNGVDALGTPHRFSKILPCGEIIICLGWRGIAADIVSGVEEQQEMSGFDGHLFEYPGDTLRGVDNIIIATADHQYRLC